MSDCIFCRIVRGEIPAAKVYEDEHVFAFKDIAPKAPVHILVIPKQHIATLSDVRSEDSGVLGHLLAVTPRIAAEQGCTDGFRSIINTGRVGGQEVYHLHLHILGGDTPLPGMLKY
ncbi:MAG: histidine triad nucleotide-binding protein [Moraxellaceae bacterium]|nr:histidine triad nucleotide-binding protein [Moraxellaceae bacterium]